MIVQYFVLQNKRSNSIINIRTVPSIVGEVCNALELSEDKHGILLDGEEDGVG